MSIKKIDESVMLELFEVVEGDEEEGIVLEDFGIYVLEDEENNNQRR